MTNKSNTQSCKAKEKSYSQIVVEEFLEHNKQKYGNSALGITIMELIIETCSLLSKSNREEYGFDMHRDWKVKFTRRKKQ